MTDAYYVERKYAFNPTLDTPPDPAVVDPYDNTSINLDATPDKANLITSLVKNGSVKVHAPVIDLDIPCELLPSSQLGHYHLYIHKEISWIRYVDILKALAAAGIVEQGYCDSSLKRGYSSLRPIGKTKPGIQVRMSTILAENATLKHENYMLRNELERLKQNTDSSADEKTKVKVTPITPGTYETAMTSLKDSIINTYTYKQYKTPAIIDDLF